MRIWALLGITTGLACHGPDAARARPGQPAEPTVSGRSAGAKVPAAAPASPAPGTTQAAAVDRAASEIPEVVEPPGLPSGALAAWKPPAADPPEVATLKSLILHGDSSTKTIKALQKLTHKYPKDEELPYLLGQLYFTKLWVGDGLKAFRSAIQINPLYRSNPFLLRAAITGLSNDSDHGQVRHFLTQDVGRPAAPYLEEVLYGEWRTQVKERAAVVLREVK